MKAPTDYIPVWLAHTNKKLFYSQSSGVDYIDAISEIINIFIVLMG